MDHDDTGFLLRRAVVADAAALAAVHVDGWRWGYRGLLSPAEVAARSVAHRTSQWQEWLQPGAEQSVWLAERGGQVVGFAAAGKARDAQLPGDHGELSALYVAESAAGTGAGRALLAEAEAGLRQAGFAHAVLWVLASNLRARDFYRHHGWRPDGARQRDPGRCDGQEQVRYAKPLDGVLKAVDAMSKCLVSYHDNDPTQALAWAERAASEDDGDLLAHSAVQYLRARQQREHQGVYMDPGGFVAFVRGGGNVALYQATSARLAATYRTMPGAQVCDLGTGDGRAVLPALAGASVALTAVEPSPALFAQLQAELANVALGPGGRTTAVQATAQTFLAESRQPRWELVQATFALQSLPSAERAPLFQALAQRTERLVLVEFAVPELTTVAERAAHCARRYRRGLAEYASEPEVYSSVSQGFLMPVLFGAFDSGRPATNYEQSAARWRAELLAAGFAQVDVSPLCDYWWAPAVWIQAVA